jgi:hypothetical protein
MVATSKAVKFKGGEKGGKGAVAENGEFGLDPMVAGAIDRWRI